jgi:GDP-L-fucose synthase
MRLSPEAAIFVAGHRGMVGAAILRRLSSLGCRNLLTAERDQLDLLSQRDVAEFFASNPVDVVVLAAARVGGIHANNSFPAEFIYENLMIEANVIHAAHRAGVNELLFLGSSCIYPRDAAQPIREEDLLTGVLEPTNEPYAIAKIAGIKLCESYNRQHGRDYRTVMPPNLYGPGDNFHPDNSHVIPGLMRRFHEAALRSADEVVIWGTGTPRREFLHVDDMAAACVHVLSLPPDNYWAEAEPMRSHVNVGTDQDLPISALAELLAKITGFKGRLRFDTSRPDGAPRKMLDSSRIRRMGWSPVIGLGEGLQQTYSWLCAHASALRT